MNTNSTKRWTSLAMVGLVGLIGQLGVGCSNEATKKTSASGEVSTPMASSTGQSSNAAATTETKPAAAAITESKAPAASETEANRLNVVVGGISTAQPSPIVYDTPINYGDDYKAVDDYCASDTCYGEDKTKYPPVTVPGASPDDMYAINRCLVKWGHFHPFVGAVKNFTRLGANLTLGSFGSVISDTTRTAEPHLYLISAGVNVLGAPSYTLLNPNGFYCMKANINLATRFDIKIHCNARLADSLLNINLLSIQNDTTSALGLHILSKVTVTNVRPAGDPCIR